MLGPGGTERHRTPPVVVLVVVALAVTALAVAGCGSNTASSTSAANASPSAKAGPTARAQLRAYLVKLNKLTLPQGSWVGHQLGADPRAAQDAQLV